jgi:hypothetical protein
MADISHSRIPAKAAERWALVRKICGGGDAEALAEFLPVLNKADTSPANIERNRAYKERAVLYNATGRTRDGLLGLAFRKPPKGEESWPTQLAYLAKDCDGAGVSIYQQSQSAVCDVLETGRDGLYTDYSEALARPIIKKYKAEDIINWRESVVDGKVVRVLVVLAEEAEVVEDYETKCIPQWRELFLENGVFNVRVWQQKSEGGEPEIVEEITPRSMKAVLDFIPFEFIGAQNNDSSVDEAPLYDIAYVNRAHYRNSADYEDSVFLAGQPQPWMSGLDESWRDHLEKQGTAYLGSRAMLMLPANGAFGIAQAQPNTLAKEAMDQKEAQMIALGARLIEATQANRTATESDNDKEASTSVLSMTVSNVSEAYTRSLKHCARYLDIDLPEDAAYEINQDFVRITPDAQMIAAMVALWQAGGYAKPDLRNWLRKIGLIPAERSDEDIDADLQTEGPALGMAEGEEAITSANAQDPAPGTATSSDGGPPAAGGSGERAPVGVGAGDSAELTPSAEIAALAAAAEAIAKAADRMVPQDLAPLIEAINARESATMEFDVQPLADAIKEGFQGIPGAVVNVAAQPAPIVNVDATTTVQPQTINVAAPTVNVEPAAVTVEAAPAPDVNLTVPVTVEKSGAKTGTMKKNPDGSFTMEVQDK